MHIIMNMANVIRILIIDRFMKVVRGATFRMITANIGTIAHMTKK